MTELIIIQLWLIGLNILNVHVDARKIKIHKQIAHAVNFICYGLLVAFLIYGHHMTIGESINTALTAFFNRQLFFDIPLNLRRGLKWYYVSLDKPPKAWLDRMEVRLVGYNGKLITFIYSLLWIATLITWQLVQNN